MAFPARVVAANAPKYIKGFVDATMRERVFFNRVKREGGIVYNVGGRSYEWRVFVSEPVVSSHSVGGTVDYVANQPYQILTLEPRFLKASDAMHSNEELLNKGPEAIIKHYDKIIPQLTEAMLNRLNKTVFADGDDADEFHGIRSFMDRGTVAAGDKVAQPDDSYAGKDTDLAQWSSVWSTDLTTKPNSTIATDWPDGFGEAGYDATSPKMFNSKSTAWDTGSTTWENNCEKVLRYAQGACTVTSGVGGAPQAVIMTTTMLTQLKDHFASRNRGLYEISSGTDVGFPGAVKFEGLELFSDFNCPVNRAYLMNWKRVRLYTPASEIVASKGPTYDPHSDAQLFMVVAAGNFLWESPKFFGEIGNYA